MDVNGSFRNLLEAACRPGGIGVGVILRPATMEVGSFFTDEFGE